MTPKVKLEQGSLPAAATLCPKAVRGPTSLSFKLTVDAAQVEVSVDQRGPVVEVMGHVVQPVGLHASDPVAAVLDLQRDLDGVVLDVPVPDWRAVVKSQQLRSC